MTTRNLPKTTEPEAPAPDVDPVRVASAASRVPMETITLSHHLNIEGTDYMPGAKVRVTSDYARHLRQQGYAART